MTKTNCPCHSGLEYTLCCQPFLCGEQFPRTAEQLMRSRYTAYTQQRIDYIVQTTVPSQQKLLDRLVMQRWAETTKWEKLVIVEHQPYLTKQHSMVTFNAFFNTESGIEVHHERSLFVKIGERWYFVDPTVPLPTQKAVCLCGSMKKFKHCCGRFLG